MLGSDDMLASSIATALRIILFDLLICAAKVPLKITKFDLKNYGKQCVKIETAFLYLTRPQTLAIRKLQLTGKRELFQVLKFFGDN